MYWPFSDLTPEKITRMAMAGRWDLVHRAACMAINEQRRRTASPLDAHTLPEIDPDAPAWETEPWAEPEYDPSPVEVPEDDPFNPDFPEDLPMPTPKLRHRRSLGD